MASAGSSNGRTVRSERINRGSNPRPATKVNRPVGLLSFVCWSRREAFDFKKLLAVYNSE